jgi:hypothetical protein
MQSDLFKIGLHQHRGLELALPDLSRSGVRGQQVEIALVFCHGLSDPGFD